jgi:hypothetical protein
MARWKAIAAACGIAAGLWLEVCQRQDARGTRDDRKETAPSAARDERPAAMDLEKSKTMDRLRRELDTLSRSVDELKRRIDKGGSKVKQETRDETAALERVKDKVAAQLDSLGRTTSQGWDTLKERTAQGMDSLKIKVDRLRDKAADKLRTDKKPGR